MIGFSKYIACNSRTNKTTFPPKGKLPQLSSYLAFYQIISRLKQGIEQKTFFFNFENINGTDNYGDSTSWQNLLDNKVSITWIELH